MIAEEAQVDAAGSSPRVRGKLPAHELNAAGQRLIPACAGKTRASHATSTSHSAHPRVCGENAGRGAPGRRRCGSSPRVRGKQLLDGLGGVGGGLIPACAGKTTSTPGSTQSWTAHPRVCGENGAGADPDGVLDGSSPRVRGKHPHGHQQIAAGRLIPACAGKTLGVPPWDLGHMAHPRVCGENVLGTPTKPSDRGSSPRVRGKPGRAPAHPVRLGLIPACAGKTGRRGYALRAYPAHPRVCGENLNRMWQIASHGGSSPRVRGKQPRTRPWSR